MSTATEQVTKNGTYWPTWLEERVADLAETAKASQKLIRRDDYLHDLMVTRGGGIDCKAIWGCLTVLDDVEERLRRMIEDPSEFECAGGATDGEISWLGCRVATLALYLERHDGDADTSVLALVRSLANSLADLSVTVDERSAEARGSGAYSVRRVRS